MLSFKPEMNAEQAANMLRHALGGNVDGVTPIDQGEISRVFSFRHGGAEYVAHFKDSRDGFDKERYLYETIASPQIPIPRVVRIGEMNGLCFKIAEKAPGQAVIRYPPDTIRKILPDLVRKFAAIREVRPAPHTTGYGWIAPTGDGTHDSWPAFLASFFLEEQTGFWHGWYALFEETFLERDLFERLYAEMMEKASASPTERCLVHGDFHLANMLSDGLVVTGIVDWEMAMYGDFVFDLAIQHLWTPYLNIPGLIRDAWAEEGRDIPRFEERLACALLFKGLDGLRFYAKKGDRASYESIKRDLLALV
ncbi:aminoglycoside phosphotransferase [Paenibacillus sp. 32O-W]|uniref:phosphotransferase family protein n=1 Tax=Paenibacillus sp. 32O-W TaxID=1695218 RepID=UPI0007228468|nr:aminoglycoside phosphotransferase family protein [Paenibacillus sp. 32O-W]ALS25886.1 aminoglycoside phosphotransferase [Paenibacillus sp. 32O-W]